MDIDEKFRLREQLKQGFTPGEAINSRDLFAGRGEQVQDVLDAIRLRGTHIALFGERGVGKTSLARTLREFLTFFDYHAVTTKTINCDVSDNFTSLWHKALREMPIVPADGSNEAADDVKCLDDLLPKNRPVTPNDVRVALSALAVPSIVIFDEVDRLQHKETKTLLADTIKTLTDQQVDCTIMLVGVADSIDGLIEEHWSIARSLEQVQMPRMSKPELCEIVDRGLEKVDLNIAPLAKDMIARLSQGFPYYVHYLGLHSGYAALDEGRDFIELVDVFAAATRVVGKAARTLRSFNKAITSPQKNIYEEVLIACALCEKDEFGFFYPADISLMLQAITGKAYYVNTYQRHLNEFILEKRGPVLEQIGSPRNYRYRFADPLMQPFAILHGISSEKLSVSVLIETQRRSPAEFEVFFPYGENQNDDESRPF